MRSSARIAARYGQIVKQLIERGKWKEMPASEDLLPDEWMPEQFFEYWSIPSPHDENGHDCSERVPQKISVTYPLFILKVGTEPVIVDGTEGDVPVRVFPVFTDRKAAERYRDENYCRKGKVNLLPDEESFARALRSIKELVALVAFDASRIDKREQTIPVDEVLRQLPDIP